MLSDAIAAQLAQFKNIPNELKALPQWCLWRAEDIGAAKPTKIPYSINGSKASIISPQHWSSFDDVCEAFKGGHYSGIGFVFTANDPYIFIDLDKTDDPLIMDRQRKLFMEFNSYSELSPSGVGLHIIAKGPALPNGRKRYSIEIYSDSRYATFTGNTYHNVGIRDCYNEVISLWEQLGTNAPQQLIYKGDVDEKQSDEEIIRIASEAANGEKFQQLYKGDFSAYPSQSEADISLVNIIAFYTKNRAQIARIFRLSGLGKRAKAKRQDYLNWMIDKSFDKEIPPIDLDGLKIEIDKVIRKDGDAFAISTSKSDTRHLDLNYNQGANGSVAQRLEPAAHNGSVAGSSPAASTIYNHNHNAIGYDELAGSINGKSAPFEGVNVGSSPTPAAKSKKSKPLEFSVTKEKLYLYPPPGLVGEIANFIYQAAPRPVPEIAIAAAIGLMSGICGRAYNVSSTGLNQYILLLAKTGRGKEAIQSGISKLVSAVKMQVPTIEECIGPDEIASGPALYKYLNKNPCFVSVLSEFGLRLQQISDAYGNGSNVSLRRMILQLYAKSGFNDVAHPSIYSDKDRNVTAIPSPSFSILGESTPHTFYRNLTEEMISEGLLPRFLLIEYDGNRVPENSGHAQIKPSNDLIDKLAAVAANAAAVQNAQPRRFLTVGLDEQAKKISDKYSHRCDKFINDKTNNEVVIELWNRAHLKVLKLAAIVAVGVDMWNPMIIKEHMEWAIGMVDADIDTLSKRFEEGQIGANTGEVKQIDEIIRVMKDYISSPWDEVYKYCSGKDEKLHSDRIITYSYISKRLIAVAAFRNDKFGATNAIRRALQILIDRDYIQEVSREQLKQKFGTTQKSYMITNTQLLKEV